MKKIILTLITTLLFSLFIKGQKNFIGGSFNFGSQSIYNMLGLAVHARIVNHIDLDLGASMSFFYGNGYSGGISLVPFKKKLQPFIGVHYGKSFGGEIDYTERGKDVGYYDVSTTENLYLKSGLMIKIEPRDGYESVSNQMFIVFTLSYRKSISNYSVEYVRGTVYKDESIFNDIMSNQIGFNFSIVYLLGSKKYSLNNSDK